MARRRAKKGSREPERVFSPPPPALSKLADDPTQLWVLDANTSQGRRIYLGSFDVIQGHLDGWNIGDDLNPDNPAQPMEPCVVLWVYPIKTAWERHRFSRLAERGWFRGETWYQPPVERKPGRVDPAIEAQMDEWRREAMQGGRHG